MSLAALLFDVDGTLADTEETHRQAFNATFAEAGLPFAWDAVVYERLLQVTGGKERLAHFFDSQSLSSEEKARLLTRVPELHRAKNRKYAELVSKRGAPLRPGIARLLGEAEAAGIRLGIATTTSPENVLSLLEAELGAGADTRFAVIASGDMVRAKKPAPDIYDLALSRLDLSPDRVIAFEDSQSGLSSAKSAGIFTVVTPNRWTQAQDFARADLIVPHLGDPLHPLDADASARARGPYLTLETLVAMHARASARSSRRRDVAP